MIFECKKTENCFSNSQTYEYALPVVCEALTPLFATLGELRRNEKLRRPIFALTLPDGTVVKGTLAQRVLRASFPDADAARAKAEFERFLSDITTPAEAVDERK